VNIDLSQIAAGMQVVGAAGEEIGHVKAIRTHDFVLDLMLRRDRYVPFSAIQELRGDKVVLSVGGDDIDALDWDKPALLGEVHESDTAATDPQDSVVGRGDPERRGTWSASSDSYDIDPLDTTPGRSAIEGTDDGEVPPPGDSAESQRLRDTAG
jgi:hypothetical protein